MSDYLPPELMFKIFSRLPIKDIMQSRCVCKSWCSIINDPDFISQTNQTLATTTPPAPLLLLRQYSKDQRKEHYSLHFDDPKFGEYAKLNCPLSTLSKYYFRIVGSCNGVLCLSDDYSNNSDSILLWNPSINKSVTIPPPNVSYNPYMYVLGFGFERGTNDYKVVRISYLLENETYGYSTPPEVEVYSLSTGSWRSINSKTTTPYVVFGHLWSQVFFRGSCHWIAYNPHETNNSNVILSFDVVNEVFGELMLPPIVKSTFNLHASIGVYKEDSLCVFHYNHRSMHKCYVWVMKEYGESESWTQLFTISIGFRWIERGLGFTKDGRVLLETKSVESREKLLGELFLYDPKTRESECLGIFASARSFHVEPFVKSLNLLNARKELCFGDGRNCSCEEEGVQMGCQTNNSEAKPRGKSGLWMEHGINYT